ncbi:unnamed protein product [Brassica oleracea]
MEAKPKRRIVTENGDTWEDLVLATLIGNGDDVARKKKAKFEDLCKAQYEEFIVAVDELRGVLVDAEELKSDLASD